MPPRKTTSTSKGQEAEDIIAYPSNPTPIEQLQWNPRQLDEFDEVVLPDGRIDTIIGKGWRWAHLQGGAKIMLKDLRRPTDPSTEPEQLELL